MKAGAQALIREMSRNGNQPTEVVIGANGFGEPNRPAEGRNEVPPEPAIPAPPSGMTLSFTRELDLARYPVLASHKLDGKPVVPFALMAEWFGHSALHENPGLRLVGIDNMRLLHGIKLGDDGQQRIIRLLAGKPRKRKTCFEVDVELRDGLKAGKEVIHSRATAILCENPSPPSSSIRLDSVDTGNGNYGRSVDEIYEKILFHGFDLQGLRQILNLSEKGMSALIASAPSPAKWMKEPLRNRWISDPLILDSAFQMATVWCYEKTGQVSLPVYAARYRQYRDQYPGEGVTAFLEVREASSHKMTGDFTFLDDENIVVARIEGYEAIMDTSLYRAFKPEYFQK
jgi:hypothetical protein